MLHYFFHFYDGAIYSNLLASIIWATPALLWGRRHVQKVQRHLDAQDARSKLMHKNIKEIHQKVHSD